MSDKKDKKKPELLDEAINGTPTELEQQIQAKRDHLAATIDELTSRAKPKEVARRTAAALSGQLQAVTHTDEGELRTERLAAVAGAFVVVLGVLVYIRGRG